MKPRQPALTVPRCQVQRNVLIPKMRLYYDTSRNRVPFSLRRGGYFFTLRMINLAKGLKYQCNIA